MRHLFITTFISLLLIISFSSLAVEQNPKEKHPEDPTKVITKIGIGYSDKLTFSGSFALDRAKKINGNINAEGDEWRIGGSWLFNFGIINFSLGRSKYDNGGTKDNYSVGTFLPLTALGVDTGKWMVFPMAGLNHNKTNTITEGEPSSLEELTMQQNTSNGGYIGTMVMRPLTEHWTAIGVVGGGLGSDSYTNIFAGGGASYKINQQHSFNLFAFASEDDFGSISKLVINYTYEFK